MVQYFNTVELDEHDPLKENYQVALEKIGDDTR